MGLFLPDRISLNLIRWTLSPSFIHLMDCASGKGLFDGNLGRSIYEMAHPWTERPERQRTASAAGPFIVEDVDDKRFPRIWSPGSLLFFFAPREGYRHCKYQ